MNIYVIESNGRYRSYSDSNYWEDELEAAEIFRSRENAEKSIKKNIKWHKDRVEHLQKAQGAYFTKEDVETAKVWLKNFKEAKVVEVKVIFA